MTILGVLTKFPFAANEVVIRCIFQGKVPDLLPAENVRLNLSKRFKGVSFY